jgi:acid phosphatase family membrane protein YuiD
MIEQLILSIALSWIIAKIIKTVTAYNREKSFEWKELLYDGGMPSAHTALVVSTATAIFLERGLSIYFVIAVVLALIVMNDAMKVRLVTQEQSKVINKMTKGKKGFPVLDEHIGHTPMEVLVGLVFGIIIPLIVYSLF